MSRTAISLSAYSRHLARFALIFAIMSAFKNAADGKPTRRHHAHMRTTKLPGINTEVAKQLETYFSLVPPLAAVSSDNLKGPESISLGDIDHDAEFA
ncbi:uncharacterized protein BJ212DRAFT_1336686 [Suillus subaureus]|uniref:Uncharacterized protein n=1 Tax=Suillus subaureus TaxID=48587 RepID=A0A9P7EHB7_9AGAM|nr:uncharacterized protein BJ212DRAFT_1336686 [Suillus subaureus]KAG1820975.1 hypothetical protein BJ212DRAFT_1336686 [Suillus subaureus]